MPRQRALDTDRQTAAPLKRELVSILKIVGDAAEAERTQATNRIVAPTEPIERPPARPPQRAPQPYPSQMQRHPMPRPALPSAKVPSSARNPSAPAGAMSHEPFIIRAKLVARSVPRRPADPTKPARNRIAKDIAPQGPMAELRLVFAFLGRSFAIPELATGIQRIAAFVGWAIGLNEPARSVRAQTAPRHTRSA